MSSSQFEDWQCSPQTILETLAGVDNALQLPLATTEPILQWLSTRKGSLRLAEWRSLVRKTFDDDRALCASILLALSLSYLHRKVNDPSSVSSRSLDCICDDVSEALQVLISSVDPALVARDAHGHWTVPLSSIDRSGNETESFQLDLWIPDEQREANEVFVRRQSSRSATWVLFGNAEMELSIPKRRTCSEGFLNWLQSSFSTATAKEHPRNLTGPDPRTTPGGNFRSLSRNMTYASHSASVCRTKVAPGSFFAAIRYSKGSMQLAKGSAADITDLLSDKNAMILSSLGNIMSSVRLWEEMMDHGDACAQRSQWEDALKAFTSALNLCETCEMPHLMTSQRHRTVDYLGFTNRCLGRYAQASLLLEKELIGMEPSRQKMGLCKELGTVYLLMNRLENAEKMFEQHYMLARQFGKELAMCQAVGNLGIINYLLYRAHGDKSLLETAVSQLEERVQRARELRISTPTSEADINYARTLESIGLARLSLCYTDLGDLPRAEATALKSVNMTKSERDRSVSALSRFYYGRALWFSEKRAAALRQWNEADGCTSVIALCKEPSDEHCQYLCELRDAGARFDTVDDEGYSALDYVVFNNHASARAIVVEAISQQLGPDADERIDVLLKESGLRKGYRQIFQDKLRPILVRGGPTCLSEARKVYADVLSADDEKQRRLDGLNYVKYDDFAKFGRFPRSTDGLTQRFSPDDSASSVEFLVFFSYRWINPDPWASSPDDHENSQYARALRAVDDLLQRHRSINPERLGVWIDYACIDQENPMPGIAALPMVIAQCDAVISLVDDSYYDRAWCSVEVMMAHALRDCYKLHMWYEHVPSRSGKCHDGHSWTLREGPSNFIIDLAKKRVRYEQDRPRISFIEKQIRLLC